MATKTIDQLNSLSSGSVVAANDVLPIVSISGNSTNKITVNDLKGAMNIQGGLAGTNYVYVAANGTDVENAAQLQAAYNTAKTMSPSSTNRITVIASPGKYNFGSSYFTMDTQYIDLVSLDGNRSIIFNGSYTIFINANNVFVKGVDVLTKPFEVNSNLNLIKVENCKGGNNSLGSNSGFILSGTFIDCEMGDNSFAAAATTLSGTFINCIAGSNSFGQGSSTLSGMFTNCKAGSNSFGTTSSIVSGTFTSCVAGNNSFGSTGTASGIFTNCIGGAASFGGNLSGTLTGKLYYCRLTSGTFKTVGIGGLTIYCIDGNNNPNNQGFISQNNL